jgi:hypothetical protein
MVFSHSPLFFRPWPFINTTWAVKACTVVYGCIVYNYGTVNIGIVYNRNIYTANSSIIPKMASIPTASIITMATIAKTIVYAAVKANMWPPVTGMKAVVAAFKTPITGCP